MIPKRGQSVANWDPGSSAPKGRSREKLLSPNAKEVPDNVTGTNELKQFEGKKGTPSEPFGLKGKNF